MRTQCSREITEYNRMFGEASNIYARYAASHGISTTTMNILYSIYTREDICTQSQICKDWEMPRQTINSCLKGLEKDGIVTLTFCDGNRKSKHIRLTSQGEEMAGRIIAPLIQRENAAFQALEPEERQLYLQIIQKHTGLLQTMLLDRHED